MTEIEAIKYIEKWYHPTTEPKERKEAIEALAVVYKALEEIQRYRSIGTVEECREAREKQKPKKFIVIQGSCFRKDKSGEEQHEIICLCPACKGKDLKKGYPCKCGQIIDWRYGRWNMMDV